MEKAMFFDLQGTLGGDFLGDIRTFEFYPFAIEALKLAKTHGYLVFIMTNQSRIAKGFFNINVYHDHEERVVKEMQSFDLFVDGFFCCPHDKGECSCKKPKDGMIQMARKEFDIDIAESYVVGDLGASDMNLSKNVGSKSILVLTGGGRGSLEEFKHLWLDVEATIIAENVLEGINKVIRSTK